MATLNSVLLNDLWTRLKQKAFLRHHLQMDIAPLCLYFISIEKSATDKEPLGLRYVFCEADKLENKTLNYLSQQSMRFWRPEETPDKQLSACALSMEARLAGIDAPAPTSADAFLKLIFNSMASDPKLSESKSPYKISGNPSEHPISWVGEFMALISLHDLAEGKLSDTGSRPFVPSSDLSKITWTLSPIFCFGLPFGFVMVNSLIFKETSVPFDFLLGVIQSELEDIRWQQIVQNVLSIIGKGISPTRAISETISSEFSFPGVKGFPTKWKQNEMHVLETGGLNDHINYCIPNGGGDLPQLLQEGQDRLRYHFTNMRLLLDRLSENFRKPFQNSATAAIMSRNMSHNLGSHALANSKFFESVGLLDQTEKGVSADKESVRAARGRLQSFNQYCQGRLDFIARKLSEDGDKPEPLFFLNDVLRGFASQEVLLNTLLDDNGFRLIKIEFHLHGFAETTDKNGVITKMESGTIWKYILDSKSGPRSHTGWKFSESQMDGKPNIQDFLIGTTGGTTGCHALYALLENMLRNAAKYSRSKVAKLELHIEVAEDKDANDKECYLLRLWENLTDDTGGAKAKQAVVIVREGLNADLIDDNGQPVKGGHGVLEMKICAEYLAGKELVFESDRKLLISNSDSEYAKYLRSISNKTPTGPANVASDAKNAPVWLQAPPLRAYGAKKGNRQALVYEMLLPKPTLLGIVCVRTVENTAAYGHKCKLTNPCVKRYQDLEEMAGDNPHFGIVVAHDAEPETILHTLKGIAENERHTALPYRLLIVTKSKEHCEAWERAVLNAQADATTKPPRYYPATKDELKKAVEHFALGDNSAPILPNRRVHVIVDPGKPSEPNQPGFFCGKENGNHLGIIRREEWNDMILAVYAAWIRVWKKEPVDSFGTVINNGRWNLLIGFERDAGQIEEHWREPLATFSAARDLLNVYVASKPSEITLAGKNLPSASACGTKIDYSSVIKRHYINAESRQDADIIDATKIINPSKACIVFDNHGRMFGTIDPLTVRVYHKFSGGEISLYQMLESPPASLFGFAFFILSFLESCLLNVVTLDERVADATISEGNLDFGSASMLEVLRAAGIHPLYSFGYEMEAPTAVEASQEKDSELHNKLKLIASKLFITPNIQGWLDAGICHDTKSTREATVCQIHEEGVRYKDIYSVLPLKEMASTGVSVLDGLNAPDAIIVHEGITDTLCKAGHWTPGDHRRLYGVLPAVIRTSGRGKESRELGNELPFVELNVLSDSIYGSQNKIRLARAIMNSAGDEQRKDAP